MVFRGEASSVRHLQKEVQFNVQLKNPPEATFWSKALRLRLVSCKVHTVRSPETSQAASHQRETVHLPRLQQEVHQRIRPQVRFTILYITLDCCCLLLIQQETLHFKFFIHSLGGSRRSFSTIFSISKDNALCPWY